MNAEQDITMLRKKAGIAEPLSVHDPVEKVMMGEAPVARTGRSRPEGSGSGKPHYSRLLVYGDKAVLAVGCCKPLTVLAAEIDGTPVQGTTILSEHSEEKGGKLLYEIKEKGNRLVVDLKRGESSRFQRVVFAI